MPGAPQAAKRLPILLAEAARLPGVPELVEAVPKQQAVQAVQAVAAELVAARLERADAAGARPISEGEAARSPWAARPRALEAPEMSQLRAVPVSSLQLWAAAQAEPEQAQRHVAGGSVLAHHQAWRCARGRSWS